MLMRWPRFRSASESGVRLEPVQLRHNQVVAAKLEHRSLCGRSPGVGASGDEGARSRFERHTVPRTTRLCL